jgi:hypothetical protein
VSTYESEVRRLGVERWRVRQPRNCFKRITGQTTQDKQDEEVGGWSSEDRPELVSEIIDSTESIQQPLFPLTCMTLITQ